MCRCDKETDEQGWVWMLPEHAWHCWLWTGMNMDRCSYRYWIWNVYIYIHASCTYTYRPSSKQGKHADLEVQSILCESFLQHCVAFLRVRLSVALVVDDHAVPISWLAGIWARAFWWRGGGSGWSGGQTHRGCCDSQKVLSFKILSASFSSWAYWAFWSCLYFPGTLGMLFVFRNHIPRTFLHVHVTFKGTWFPTLTCGGTTWTCGCGGWRGTR